MNTDGASLPIFFRNYIVISYGHDIMFLIDRAGHFHDELTIKYPNTAAHNRRRFIKLLMRFKIPKKLVVMINLGLFIYDISPSLLKKLFKKTTVIYGQ